LETARARCQKCGVVIDSNQNVLFPRSGGVAHLKCAKVRTLHAHVSSDVPLVQRVRRRLDDGTLPRECPEKVWSGPALDEQGCSGCGDQILGAQTIYVFNLADLTFAFHIGCYGLWLGELVRRGLYRPT
jgi:hypothetical protein